MPTPMTLRASEIALNSSMEMTDCGDRQVTCLPMPEVIILVKRPPATMPMIWMLMSQRNGKCQNMLVLRTKLATAV